jgi:hypothetical protein
MMLNIAESHRRTLLHMIKYTEKVMGRTVEILNNLCCQLYVGNFVVKNLSGQNYDEHGIS